MNEYIVRYVVSNDLGVIYVRYTANNDDESIKIAKSVCEKLGEEDIKELTIEKVIGTVNVDITSNLLGNKSPGTGATADTSVSQVIDTVITKVIYFKNYPCIKPRPFEEIVNYVDLERLEEIANEH